MPSQDSHRIWQQHTTEFSVHPILSLFIESNLAGVPSSWMTELFIWATMIVFVFALHSLKKRKFEKFVEYAPTLMTSLGILGTFVGILIGLLAFDTSNIDKSIPNLLEGLKTAFVTSIVGMSFTVFFNGISRLVKNTTTVDAELSSSDVSPSDMLAELKSQSNLIREMANKLGDEEGTLIQQTKLMRTDVADMPRAIQAANQNLLQAFSEHKLILKTISDGLTGTEEGSLIGKIQLMRGDISDFSKNIQRSQKEFSERLWSELDKFAEMMSKSATSHIIEALSQVINDFNKNLTEQFGENFKALDASVKKLVEWQEEYRLHVEQMGIQYQRSVESIGNTENAVAVIRQECDAIPHTMQSLQKILETNQQQIKELENHLQAFVAMRDAAVIAIPTIQEKIDEVSEQLRVGALNMHKGAEDITQAATHVSSELEVSVQKISGSSEKVASATDTLNQQMQQTSQTLLDNTQFIQTALTEGANQLKASVADSQAVMGNMAQEVKETAVVLSASAQTTQQQLTDSAQVLSAGAAEVKEKMQQTSQTLLDSTQFIQTALTEGANQLKASVADSQAVMGNMAQEVKETAVVLSASAQTTQQSLRDSAKFIFDSGLELKDVFAHAQTAVTNMVNKIDSAAVVLDESTQSIRNNLEGLINQLSVSSKELSELLKNGSVEMSKNNKELIDNVQRSANEIKQFSEQIIGNMDRGVKSAIEESGKVVNKSLEQLELATAREIEKAMRDMGESLVKITSRFVKDYERMVHAMNDVINQQPNKRL